MNEPMTATQKKEYAERLIANGDKRSYNEIKADLGLMIWKKKHGGV